MHALVFLIEAFPKIVTNFSIVIVHLSQIRKLVAEAKQLCLVICLLQAIDRLLFSLLPGRF